MLKFRRLAQFQIANLLVDFACAQARARSETVHRSIGLQAHSGLNRSREALVLGGDGCEGRVWCEGRVGEGYRIRQSRSATAFLGVVKNRANYPQYSDW